MKRASLWLALGGWIAFLLPAESAPGTLQARIDAARAGDTIEVDGGVHEGPLRIEKPITLAGLEGAVIEGGGSGHVIHILAPDVRVEGLLIRGSGLDLSRDHAGIMIEGDRAEIVNNRIEDSLHGIYLKEARDCSISHNRITGKKERLVPVEDILSDGLRLTPDGEMCIIDLSVHQRGNGIHLWNSVGNRLENNEIADARDGIYFSFSDRSMVRGNFVHNVRYGLHYMYSDENVFENNRFENNAAGAAIMYSRGLFVRGNSFTNNRGRRAYGLLLNAIDDTTVVENELRRNTIGVYLENSNRNHFLGNAVGANYVGVRLTASSADNSFSRNQFTRNLHSVELDRSSAGNDWAPQGTGNFWSGSETVDLTGDGRSEFMHREADLLGAYRREFPVAGLLSQSPALQLLEYVQSKVPVPGISAIIDPAPLTRPPSESGRD